jgi:hypothetical protein
MKDDRHLHCGRDVEVLFAPVERIAADGITEIPVTSISAIVGDT